MFQHVLAELILYTWKNSDWQWAVQFKGNTVQNKGNSNLLWIIVFLFLFIYLFFFVLYYFFHVY